MSLSDTIMMMELLKDRGPKQDSYRPRHSGDRHNPVKRIENMRRELEDMERMFKKKEDGKDKKSSFTSFEVCLMLCFASWVFGPFILWAQLHALHQLISGG